MPDGLNLFQRQTCGNPDLPKSFLQPLLKPLGPALPGSSLDALVVALLPGSFYGRTHLFSCHHSDELVIHLLVVKAADTHRSLQPAESRILLRPRFSKLT